MIPEKLAIPRRRWRVLGIALAAALVVSACGSSDSENGTTTSENGTTTVVLGGSDVGAGALMVEALFQAGDELDVEVEFQPMAQSTAQIALVNGEIDMGFMSIVNLASAHEQGDEMIGVAPTWSPNASLVVEEDSPYEDPHDLEGEPVASLGRTVSVFSESYFVLEDMGIDMENDYDLMLADSGGLLQGLLDTGEMEAITQYEPNTTRMMLEGGYRELFHTSEYWREQGTPPPPGQNWAVRADWLEDQDAELIRRLGLRATEIAKTDEALYEENGEAVNLPAPEGTDLLFERFAPLLVDEYTDENMETAQTELDRAKRLGLLQQDHDIADLVLRGDEE